MLQKYSEKSKRNGKSKTSSNSIKLVWLQTLVYFLALLNLFTYLFRLIFTELSRLYAYQLLRKFGNLSSQEILVVT